ncbi:MAG: protein kinase [Acidobacteriia bacterium]|nr:protein kinase [Terriglobia bacterium]
MPGRRAPWWMYVVAAAYVGLVALFFYQVFAGPPILPGFEGRFTSGGMAVLSVHPGSPEARAGLEEGDRVLAVNEQVIRNVHDWEGIRANTEIGRPERWQVGRANQRLELTVAVPRLSWRERLSGVAVLHLPFYWVNVLGYSAFVLTCLILGLVVAFRRPYDPAARMGAWVLATAAVAFGLPDGWAATWRHLPGLLGLLIWIPEISRLVPDAILFTFFTVFPRRVFSARWPWLLIWTPALAFLPWRVLGMYRVVYQPGHATDVPVWVFSAISLRSAVFVMASLAVLILSYRRLEDANHRRRVRVVLTGVLASTLGVVGWVAIGAGRGVASWLLALQNLLYLLWLAFPLSFAYAILRHRLFDVGVLIRQGLQYAAARGALLSLVPVLVAVMFGDALLHGEQPLLEIVRARGWVYGTLGALALLAHARRRQWLSELDRRFFRERYDAQQLLREVVEEVREAGSFERVAPRVVARIEVALHPEFVALLVREPPESGFRSLAAAPAGQAPASLPAESKLLALLRVLGKPLEVTLTESGWLKQQLPHEETDFLRQARIELVVPVAIDHNRREALLALGAKRSEEPYTREDQDLLVAIAASLALLLEKPAPEVVRVSEAFEECPECGTCYDTRAGRCTQEGANLVPTRLPRLLAGRYRLERRRGQGGMGAVYEAVDTALERRVAVKVIRDDLVGSMEAAERFRREARAAASFTHPNVVTVHDFGVAAGTRAFLVMELLEGLTLREELKRQKRFEPPRTVAILRGVCEAVEAAHRRLLVHRDLKPDNIFLVRAETGEIPKVLDFGIAKFLPTDTRATADTGPGQLVGTIAYMSPEQWLGQPVDAAWDLWALAIVAYEMLTGAQPFAGGVTPADWQVALLAGRFTPVAKHLPEAPAQWQEFFARAFALERERRPGSARVFFSALEQALG